MVKERFRKSLYRLWDEFIETYGEAVSGFVSKNMIRDSYCSSLTAKLELLVDQVYVEHEYAQVVADHGGPVGELTMEDRVPMGDSFVRTSFILIIALSTAAALFTVSSGLLNTAIAKSAEARDSMSIAMPYRALPPPVI